VGVLGFEPSLTCQTSVCRLHGLPLTAFLAQFLQKTCPLLGFFPSKKTAPLLYPTLFGRM
jgi:hypothetical protein